MGEGDRFSVDVGEAEEPGVPCDVRYVRYVRYVLGGRGRRWQHREETRGQGYREVAP